LATEESTKYKATKEVIRSLTAQVTFDGLNMGHSYFDWEVHYIEIVFLFCSVYCLDHAGPSQYSEREVIYRVFLSLLCPMHCLGQMYLSCSVFQFWSLTKSLKNYNNTIQALGAK
jgi:hypothetical protein